MPGGRPAQPATLRLLNGSGGGRDSGGRKVQPGLPFKRVAPSPPEWLSVEARAEWDRVIPGLTRLDVLKPEDRALLVAYCETWSTYVAATETVAREGMTIEARQGTLAHPAVGIARATGRELRAFASQFGLSPSSESVLATSADDDLSQGNNPFAAGYKAPGTEQNGPTP